MKTRFCCHNLLSAALAAVFIAGAITLTGCEDPTESPREVVASFLDDLRYGNHQQALDALWPDTRQQLQAGYDDLEQFFDQQPPLERHEMLVITRVENPMVITRIRPEEPVPEDPSDGERITMTIELRDDRTASADVRFSDDEQRWFVDLPVDQRRPLRVMVDQEGSDSDEDDDREADQEARPDDSDRD